MKPTRYYSNRQEKAVAKKVSGNKVINSGATAFAKGDVNTEQWLIECKTSIGTKSSFSIKKEWLVKNREEMFSMGRDFNALCFDFGDSDRYYIIDEKMFLRLINLLKEEK